MNSASSTYQTTEDRAAFIKRQAEQRMAERLEALGLKPPSKTGESSAQKQERESAGRDERFKRAEQEDAKRSQERQTRLEHETLSPPTPPRATLGKKPPPPPSRSARAGRLSRGAEATRKAEEQTLVEKAEQEGKAKAIRAQKDAQEAQTRQLEYVNPRQNV